MSLFSKLFGDSNNERDVKVRQSNENLDRRTGDRYTKVDGGHVHQSYNIDVSSGEYREYTGGENSSDRSYNKK